jgi:large subunit ribosomal protein L9
MKVLLKKNISKVGAIGDVVEVRDGYARNYLLPQGLAIEPTEGNLRAIEAEKQAYLAQLARDRAEIQAKANLIRGKEVTIAARANEEGHLYGSIGPAQIVAALAGEGVFVEPENIALDEPIRRLDKYDVPVRFAEGISATIHVWVVPHHEGPEPAAEAAPDAEAPADPAGSADRPWEVTEPQE